MTEIYKLPQGKITVSFCDENLSIGLLDLNPRQALAKHNRPVNEELVQICGSCVIKVFDGDRRLKKVVLSEGEKLVIPAHQFHIHSNPTDRKSITLWKFEGNIVDVIENIRNSFEKIL
jgi:quercetin dioxygenase-like cupin family protein